MPNRLRYIEIKRDQTTNNRYYKNIEYPEIPVTPNDIYIISKSTDRLDLLAQRYFGDVRSWWIIAEANSLEVLSYDLKPGLQLRIPREGY